MRFNLLQVACKKLLSLTTHLVEHKVRARFGLFTLSNHDGDAEDNVD